MSKWKDRLFKGLCGECGKQPRVENKGRCKKHLEQDIKRQMLWNKANPEKAKEKFRKWFRGNKSKVKNWKLLSRYKITLLEYNERLEKQERGCAICAVPYGDGIKRQLSVDHDHETGKVRGLLCRRCNQVLGLVADSQILLGLLIRYLETAKKEEITNAKD